MSGLWVLLLLLEAVVASACSAWIQAARQVGHGRALVTRSYVAEVLSMHCVMLVSIALVFF